MRAPFCLLSFPQREFLIKPTYKLTKLPRIPAPLGPRLVTTKSRMATKIPLNGRLREGGGCR